VLKLQPPSENQVALALQQCQGRCQPRLRTIRVPGIQAVFREILQCGDGDLRSPLASRYLQRLTMMLKRFLPGAQVAKFTARPANRGTWRRSTSTV